MDAEVVVIEIAWMVAGALLPFFADKDMPVGILLAAPLFVVFCEAVR